MFENHFWTIFSRSDCDFVYLHNILSNDEVNILVFCIKSLNVFIIDYNVFIHILFSKRKDPEEEQNANICRCCEQCQVHRALAQNGVIAKPFEFIGPPPPYTDSNMITLTSEENYQNFYPPQYQQQITPDLHQITYQESCNSEMNFDPNCKVCNMSVCKE